MTLDHVIDTSFVLVTEAYVGAGMSVFEAIEKIEEIGKTPEQKIPSKNPSAKGSGMAKT